MSANSQSAALRYDPVTIRLHWTIAALIAIQWVGAELSDFIPGHANRQIYWSIHITLGTLLALTLAFHIVWRATKGARLPDSNEEGWRLATRAMLAILYGLPVLLVLLGFGIILARGWVLYGGLITIPPVPGGSRQLARTIHSIHELTAHVVMALAACHAAAALFHHYWLRDGVLGRMLPSALRNEPRAGSETRGS